MSTLNMNIYNPPEFVKILNNEAGNDYQALDTSKYGIPSDDGAGDTLGFFGRTKFYYGAGENDFVVGTDKGDVGDFVFK